MSMLDDDEVPIGFGMALAQNLNAMKHFSRLTEAEKEEVLNRARDAHTKNDMDALIAGLDPDNGLTGSYHDHLL